MFKKKLILTSIIFLAILSCSAETSTPAKVIQPDNQIDLQQSSNQSLDTTQNDNTMNSKIIKNEDKKSTRVMAHAERTKSTAASTKSKIARISPESPFLDHARFPIIW